MFSLFVSFSWSRNGRKLLSGSNDWNVSVWDVLSGECDQKYRFQSPVTKVQFHPRNKFVPQILILHVLTVPLHTSLSPHICLLHIPESIKPWNLLNPLTPVSDQDRTSPYQLRDYLLIQYQILQTNILMRIIWWTVRRIANEILGVKGLKGSMNQNCLNFTPRRD